MSFAATADNTAFVAPLGGQEADPEAGAKRRGFFARAWSATKGMAKAAFTKENAKNMAFGAGTMFVLKSSAAAVAAAYALPAAAATASVLGVGAAGAAGLSYYRERSAAKREGRAAEGFFSDANLRRMSLAAGISVVGGSLVAAYQGGMFAPITDKLAELAKHIHLPEVHFNLSPISDAQAYDYSPGGEMDQMYGHGAAAVTPTPHPEASASAVHPVDVAVAEKSAVPAPEKLAPAMDKASAGVEKAVSPVAASSPPPANPSPVAVADVAPVPTTGGGSALGQVREMLEQQGGKPSRSMEMLLDRAAHSAQGQKDLAVALLWGKGGFTANPELARTLLEDAVKQGNRQAVDSLAWMDKHGLGLSSSHAPVVTETHPAAPETPSGKGSPHVSAKPAMDHAAAHPAQNAASVVKAAPKTVVIAPDMPPVPVAPDGEAIACTILGKSEDNFAVECTAPTGKDFILPGEHMSIEWPGRFPDTKIEFVNEGREPLHSWRWAAGVVYDDLAEKVGSLNEAFKKAVDWRAEHSSAVQKVAESARKFFHFAFNG